MKVMQIERFGLDHLVEGQRETPEPGSGEVLLQMKAASINYRDLLMVNGFYNPKQPLPLIPCSDGVGEVLAVGSGVDSLEVGDRVATLFAQAWDSGAPSREKLRATLGGPLDGTLSEKMVLKASGVIKVPPHLSDVEAATLSCAALTAWSALVTQGQIRAGDRVLILGTGGVALFALQFAKLLGAHVIITSSREQKLLKARHLGADEVINYVENPKWSKQVLALTAGAGVDHVVEVGGAGTLNQSVRCVRPGGTVSLIGVLSGNVSDFNVIPVLMQNIRIQGVLVGHRESFEAMIQAIALHRLKPVVDSVFGWQESRSAFGKMAEASHFGKICIDIES